MTNKIICIYVLLQSCMKDQTCLDSDTYHCRITALKKNVVKTIIWAKTFNSTWEKLCPYTHCIQISKW